MRLIRCLSSSTIFIFALSRWRKQPETGVSCWWSQAAAQSSGLQTLEVNSSLRSRHKPPCRSDSKSAIRSDSSVPSGRRWLQTVLRKWYYDHVEMQLTTGPVFKNTSCWWVQGQSDIWQLRICCCRPLSNIRTMNQVDQKTNNRWNEEDVSLEITCFKYVAVWRSTLRCQSFPERIQSRVNVLGGYQFVAAEISKSCWGIEINVTN